MNQEDKTKFLRMLIITVAVLFLLFFIFMIYMGFRPKPDKYVLESCEKGYNIRFSGNELICQKGSIQTNPTGINITLKLPPKPGNKYPVVSNISNSTNQINSTNYTNDTNYTI